MNKLPRLITLPANDPLLTEWQEVLGPKKLEAAMKQVSRLQRDDLVSFHVELIRDNLRSLPRHTTHAEQKLLLRNLWASLDVLMSHLDATGAGRAVQSISKVLFKEGRFDDPRLVRLEWKMAEQFFGGPAAMRRLVNSKERWQKLFAEAEEERQKGVIEWLGSPDFTFTAALKMACFNPLMPNPAIAFGVGFFKAIAVAILIAVDTASLALGALGIPGFVISIVAIVALLKGGC
jgi:hypothetical protein